MLYVIESETAKNEKEEFQQTLHTEKENANKKIEELTQQNQDLQQEIDK